MNHKLINKYFRDQCSAEELEQMLAWFQTDEAQAFLEQDINQQNRRFSRNDTPFLYPEIESEKIFSHIQLHKKRGLSRRWGFVIRVASILLIALMLSSLLYQGGFTCLKKKDPASAFITYITARGQQKIFSLSDGTKIRLNQQSKLIVPVKTSSGKRTVTLKGEAYFEVTHDSDHPFVVNAGGGVIRDIGTKFNVKINSVEGDVEVAVIKGKVFLKKKRTNDEAGALLTRNHFGILRLSDTQITIEKENVKNYLSWINNRLTFNGQSLLQISRQFERLYNVRIQFETDHLKKLNLTADIERSDLRQVLTIISKTLDIHFKMNENHVVWRE